jgi:F0F1-type ATP synthase gamma subunit
MSNRITIEYTKFDNLNTRGEVTDSSFGYRVYDDYATAYDNTYDTFEDLQEDVNMNNFWEVLDRHLEEFDGYETANGITFCGDFYTWGDIGDIKEELAEMHEVTLEKDEKNGLYGDTI